MHTLFLGAIFSVNHNILSFKLYNIYSYHRLLQFRYQDEMTITRWLSAQLFMFYIYFSHTVYIDLRREKKALRVANVGTFLKVTIVREKRSLRNEVEKVHYPNEKATLLPNLLYANMAIAVLALLLIALR